LTQINNLISVFAFSNRFFKMKSEVNLALPDMASQRFKRLIRAARSLAGAAGAAVGLTLATVGYRCFKGEWPLTVESPV
jgi:hypothetical protein